MCVANIIQYQRFESDTIIKIFFNCYSQSNPNLPKISNPITSQSFIILGLGKEVVLKEVARGDRELARLFVEMLAAIGPGLVPRGLGGQKLSCFGVWCFARVLLVGELLWPVFEQIQILYCISTREALSPLNRICISFDPYFSLRDSTTYNHQPTKAATICTSY